MIELTAVTFQHQKMSLQGTARKVKATWLAKVHQTRYCHGLMGNDVGLLEIRHYVMQKELNLFKLWYIEDTQRLDSMWCGVLVFDRHCDVMLFF